MVIAFKFHGVVKHNGEPIKSAIDYLRELFYEHSLILLSTSQGEELYQEIKYLRGFNIGLWGININPDQSLKYPEQNYHVKYDILIDPLAVGAPLTSEGYIDWIQVRKFIKNKVS